MEQGGSVGSFQDWEWKKSSYLDRFIGDLPLKIQFPNLFRLAQMPNDSVVAHWDYVTNSWSLFFRRLLKDDEIQDFQCLLTLKSLKGLTDLDDRRVWSLETSGHFSIKSLLNHLSFFPFEKRLL